MTGALVRAPGALPAFDHEMRRRGVDLTTPCGTALDGVLILGRHVVDAGMLIAQPPYLLCSAQPVI
jgi:hypothetical protein